MAEKIILQNGIRLLLEAMPAVRTVSFGLWVETGSRHESREQAGVSHFIEHMVFKGTDSRSAGDIAREFDVLGGYVNAYTSKDCTCFYAKTLNRHLLEAMEILADMFFHSRFSNADIALEKNVVIDEIAMYEDSPEDLCSDLLSECVWRGSGLSGNILGTRRSVRRLTRESIRAYMVRNYSPDNILLSIAGSFDREEVIRSAERLFGTFYGRRVERRGEVVPYTPEIVLKRKNCEQNNLCFGFKGLPYSHADSYVLSALNNILGNGMSSRLFQKLREEMGLVYSVYSFVDSHKDAGMLGIYAACKPSVEEKTIEAILGELRRLRREGVEPDELERTRELLRTNLLMGLDNPGDVMNHNAKSELFDGYIPEESEMLARIDRISEDRLRMLTERILRPEYISLCVVGQPRLTSFYKTLRSF